jgi:hypothetical protein
MKLSAMRRFVSTSAMLVAIPLVVVGVTNLAATARHVPVPPQPLADASTRQRTEIHLTSGTGQDIQHALNSLPANGGRVMLGAGTFIISEPLIMDRDNTELTGDQELTILRLSDRVDIPLLVVGDVHTPPARRTSGVTVRKLILDGNRLAQDHECNGGPCDRGGLSHIRNNTLTIRGAEDVRIEHVTARAARSGGVVLEKGCRRIHISDFTGHDNHYDGLAAYETEDSYFTRLYLHSNAAAGISADIRFNRNIITHTRLENNGSQGIFMRDSNFNNFSRLTIRDNGQQGIFIAQADDQPNTPCTGNIFSELTVTGSKGTGLRVNDLSCVANTLVRSHFKSNVQGGVSEVGEKLLAQVDVSVE